MADDEKAPSSLIGGAVDIAKRQGVSWIIIVGMFYWLTTGISAKLDRHMDETLGLKRAVDELVSLQRQNTAASQRTCLILSRTDADRFACVVAPK